MEAKGYEKGKVGKGMIDCLNVEKNCIVQKTNNKHISLRTIQGDEQ